MKTASANQGGDREIARRINALHAETEQQRSRCCDAVYEAFCAAWQAGQLLVKQKRKVVHGNWELWLERNFEGKVSRGPTLHAFGQNRAGRSDRNCNQGKKGEEAASEETPRNKRVSGSSRLALSDYDDVGTRGVDD